jgi:hypothetical protein
MSRFIQARAQNAQVLETRWHTERDTGWDRGAYSGSRPAGRKCPERCFSGPWQKVRGTGHSYAKLMNANSIRHEPHMRWRYHMRCLIGCVFDRLVSYHLMILLCFRENCKRLHMNVSLQQSMSRAHKLANCTRTTMSDQLVLLTNRGVSREVDVFIFHESKFLFGNEVTILSA